MGARWAADAVLLLHAGFIAFVLLGGLLAWRWRRAPWLHLPAAAWGVLIEATGRICPLTLLENSLRVRAGETGYSSSFIEHHLLGLIYPEGLTREVQWALAAVVLVVNAAVYGALWWRRRRRPAP